MAKIPEGWKQVTKGKMRKGYLIWNKSRRTFDSPPSLACMDSLVCGDLVRSYNCVIEKAAG